MAFSTVKIIDGLPGFQELIPFISRQSKDIGQDYLPLMRQNLANGEWSIVEKHPEPTLPDELKSVAYPS